MLRSRFDRINQLAQTLDKEDPWVREHLTLAEEHPELVPTIQKILASEAEVRGYDLAKLPIFGQKGIPKPQRPILLGNITWDNQIKEPVCVSQESFEVSAGIFGSPKTGKSTLIMFLAPQVVSHGIGVIFFDSQHEFPRLIKLLPPEKVFVFDPETDRDNIYEPPPNVPVTEWRSALEKWFRSQNLKEGGSNLISETLESAYISADNSGRKYPNINDHLAALQARQYRVGTRHYAYYESAEDRIKRLATIPAFKCDSGYPLERLMDKVLIFKVGHLSDDKRIAYVTAKLLKLNAFYQKNVSKPGLKNICVLDECHIYVNPKVSQKYDLAEGIIPELTRSMRKYGQSFWFSTQVLTGISSSILGVLDNLFLFRLVHGASLYAISKSRYFNEEQLEYLATAPLRHMVVQSLEYPEAILVRVPDVQIPDVTEEEVSDFMKQKLESLPWTPDRSQEGTQIVSTSLSEPEKRWVKADDDLVRLLKNVAENPLLGVNERREALGWNAWHMQSRIQDCLQISFLKPPVSISFGGPGNSKKFLQLTEKGARFIGIEDFDSIQLPGKGSDTHKILQNILAQKLKAEGKNAFVEYTVNGKAVDVAILAEDGTYQALELELDPKNPHVEQNIVKDF